MNYGKAVTAAAIASIVIVPIIFESYTFRLYATGDPAFFTFSGARLWVFLAVQFASGFVVGLASSTRPATGSALIALAVGILTISLSFLRREAVLLCGTRWFLWDPDGHPLFRDIRCGLDDRYLGSADY